MEGAFHLIHVDEMDEMDEMEHSSISSTIAAVFVRQYLTLYVQLCAPDDGRRNRLQHAEQFIEINRSRKRCILLVVLSRSFLMADVGLL
jgi:hypothetical protein